MLLGESLGLHRDCYLSGGLGLITGLALCAPMYIWGFPKIRDTILGIPMKKDYSILGSILGFFILGNYHIYIYIYIIGPWASIDLGPRWALFRRIKGR